MFTAGFSDLFIEVLSSIKMINVGDDNFSKGILDNKVNTQTIGLSGNKANMTSEVNVELSN